MEDCNNNNIPDQCEDEALVPGDLLTDQDPDWHAYLGTSVSIYGRFAVSGSPGDDSGAANAGAIAIFERSILGEWSLAHELTADRPRITMAWELQYLLAIGVVVGGAPGDDDMGNALALPSSFGGLTAVGPKRKSCTDQTSTWATNLVAHLCWTAPAWQWLPPRANLMK